MLHEPKAVQHGQIGQCSDRHNPQPRKVNRVLERSDETTSETEVLAGERQMAAAVDADCLAQKDDRPAVAVGALAVDVGEVLNLAEAEPRATLAAAKGVRASAVLAPGSRLLAQRAGLRFRLSRAKTAGQSGRKGGFAEGRRC